MANPYLEQYRQRLAATQQPQQPAPQQDNGGGVLGFLKSIATPIVDTVKLPFQFGASLGANQAVDLANRANDDAVRRINEDVQAGKIDEERAKQERDKAFQLVRDANRSAQGARNEFQSINPTEAAAKAADTALTVGSLGTAGILKNVAKAGVGNAIKRGAGEGAVLGTAYGALKPVEEGSTNGEDILDSALTSGLLGGATGGALGGIFGRVGSKVSQGGRLQRTGSNLQRDVAGTSKVADSYTQENDILDALRRNGVTGSGANQYRQVDDALGNLSKSIDDELSTITKTVPRGPTLKSIKTRAIDALPDDPAFTREVDRSISRLDKSGSGDITARDLFKFKQDLGNRLSPAFKKLDRGAPLTSKEEAEMVLWRSIDDDITKIAPSVKEMTLDQSKLITARPGLQKSAAKSVGIPLLGLRSKGISRGIQATQDKVGGILSKRSPKDELASELTGLKGRGSPLVPQVLATQGIAQGVATPPEEATPTAPLGTGLSLPPAPEADTSPFTAENVQKLIIADLANGGKNVANLMKLYELFGQKQESTKPLSAEASKVVSNAQSGLDSLATLESILQKDPSAQGKSAISGAFNPLGATGALLGTGGYEQARTNITDVIARLRTGAAITNDEASRFEKLLPQPADSPELVAQKLATLRDQFNMVANRTGPSGNDVSASLGGAL